MHPSRAHRVRVAALNLTLLNSHCSNVQPVSCASVRSTSNSSQRSKCTRLISSSPQSQSPSIRSSMRRSPGSTTADPRVVKSCCRPGSNNSSQPRNPTRSKQRGAKAAPPRPRACGGPARPESAESGRRRSTRRSAAACLPPSGARPCDARRRPRRAASTASSTRRGNEPALKSPSAAPAGPAAAGRGVGTASPGDLRKRRGAALRVLGGFQDKSPSTRHRQHVDDLDDLFRGDEPLLAARCTTLCASSSPRIHCAASTSDLAIVVLVGRPT